MWPLYGLGLVGFRVSGLWDLGSLGSRAWPVYGLGFGLFRVKGLLGSGFLLCNVLRLTGRATTCATQTYSRRTYVEDVASSDTCHVSPWQQFGEKHSMQNFRDNKSRRKNVEDADITNTCNFTGPASIFGIWSLYIRPPPVKPSIFPVCLRKQTYITRLVKPISGVGCRWFHDLYLSNSHV